MENQPPQGNATNPNIADATKNSKATTGLVLGIIGLIVPIILSNIAFVPIDICLFSPTVIGLPATIIGFIFCIKGLKSLKRKAAIFGIVLNSIGFIINFLVSLITIGSFALFGYLNSGSQNSIVNKLLTQTNTTNTLSSQTYSNSKYGFKIDPPQGWTVNEKRGNGVIVGFEKNGEIIYVFSESTNDNLDSYLKKYEDPSQSPKDFKLISDTAINLNDGTTARLIAGTTSGMRFVNLITLKNGQAYNIEAGGLELNWDQYKDLIESALMTFSVN